MLKRAGFVSVLILLGSVPLFPQQKQPVKPPTEQQAQQAADVPIVIPPEEAKRVNPVKPTEASLAEGKRRFGYDCALCHGQNGAGKGEVAVSMNLKPPDFRDPNALKSVTDGGLYFVISKGHGAMPNEDARAEPGQIWNLVNYVRSFAAGKESSKTK